LSLQARLWFRFKKQCLYYCVHHSGCGNTDQNWLMLHRAIVPRCILFGLEGLKWSEVWSDLVVVIFSLLLSKSN
jgi:hypothetical protein